MALLLDESSDPSLIYAQCHPVRRNYDSLSYLLEGMFPRLHKDIAIHTFKENQDPFIYQSCPRLNTFTEDTWRQIYEKNMTQKYTWNGVLPRLSQLTGKPASLDEAKKIQDSLTCRIYFGKSIGKFAEVYDNLT